MVRQKWRSKFSGLRKEITLTLVGKVVLIMLIWYVCFSDPVSKHLNNQSYMQHFTQKS